MIANGFEAQLAPLDPSSGVFYMQKINNANMQKCYCMLIAYLAYSASTSCAVQPGQYLKELMHEQFRSRKSPCQP